MFPTHVGMNREVARSYASFQHVPHTRGDEPNALRVKYKGGYMFPTHVGMNRGVITPPSPVPNVPHTRGDEPRRDEERRSGQRCSPHTWG